MNWQHIYEGWKNHLFPEKDIKEAIDALYKQRLAICSSCIGYSNSGCTIPGTGPCCSSKVVVGEVDGVSVLGCGCSLKAKLKCPSCSCPVKKWEAVLSVDQQKEIENEQTI